MKVINLKNYGVVVFNTELTKEAILKLQRHNPDALKMKNEAGDEVFAISFNDASLSEYGICFDREDSEGKALLTITATMTNEELAEEFAAILMKAKMVETRALAAYTDLTNMLREVANSIEEPDAATVEAGEDNA